MNKSLLRITVLGDISPWGRGFMVSLQEQELIDLHFEGSTEIYCRTMIPQAKTAVIFLENTTDSQSNITALRECGKPCYIIWYGRSFTKEDLNFAIQQRVYSIFENLKPTDPKVISQIQKLTQVTESDEHFEKLIRGMKSVLIQSEEDEKSLPILHELKAAISKLEGFHLTDEFCASHHSEITGEISNIPFRKTEEFGDALITVHDLERTGILMVRGATNGEQGQIEFLQGKIISASSRDTQGLKAIYRMFLWDSPRFTFQRKDPNETHVEEYLDVSIKSLVQDGTSFKEKYEALRKELPPSHLRLELDPAALHAGTNLLPHDFTTLSGVVEFQNVSQILDYTPLPDVDIFQSLINLKRSRLIRVAA